MASQEIGDPGFLIIDPNPVSSGKIAEYLQSQNFFSTTVPTFEQGITSVAHGTPRFGFIRYDKNGSFDGTNFLRRTAAQDIHFPFITYARNVLPEGVIQAFQHGATDFVRADEDVTEVIAAFNRYTESELEAKHQFVFPGSIALDGRIVGDNSAMLEVYKRIGRFAGSDVNVLITGSTGTGKSLVAALIHDNSTRARGDFVKVNVPGLPPTLLESELFGHEKGAFTGAERQRIGRFEMAHKGTIFLDEIGDMPLSLQVKLLKVLQDREIERVGGTQVIKLDLRVIAATNKDLSEAVREGRFREDLFYRLNVANIHMPSLSEHRDDIPALVQHFLLTNRFRDYGLPSPISDRAMRDMMSHNWPGNVRELEHTIQKAVAFSQGKVVTSDMLDLNQAPRTSVE